MEQLTHKQQKDLMVLVGFVQIYCQARHGKILAFGGKHGQKKDLCEECASLVSYATEKLRKCPLDPKPSCKKCHVHCYSRENRAKIREVMAFSGKRLILRGRLDLLWHYFL